MTADSENETGAPKRRGRIPQSAWPQILERYRAGATLSAIAREFDCTPSAISYIVRKAEKSDDAPEGDEGGDIPAAAADPVPPPAAPSLPQPPAPVEATAPRPADAPREDAHRDAGRREDARRDDARREDGRREGRNRLEIGGRDRQPPRPQEAGPQDGGVGEAQGQPMHYARGDRPERGPRFGDNRPPRGDRPRDDRPRDDRPRDDRPRDDRPRDERGGERPMGDRRDFRGERPQQAPRPPQEVDDRPDFQERPGEQAYPYHRQRPNAARQEAQETPAQPPDERMEAMARSCAELYRAWRAAPGEQGMQALADALHDMRKVMARMEIDMSASRRDEHRPIPIHHYRPQRSPQQPRN